MRRLAPLLLAAALSGCAAHNWLVPDCSGASQFVDRGDGTTWLDNGCERMGRKP